MTRKCYNCGITIGLKSIVFPDCDCGKCDGFHKKSTCKKCYFTEEISCEFESHSTIDCLKNINCENHKETILRKEHWDDLNYNYKPKTKEIRSIDSVS